MAYLEIVEGDSRGKIVRLGIETIVGRNAENGLCLQDSSISRQHAVIREKENYFVMIDSGSANGTAINKRELHRHVPQPLYEGDEIVIGSYRMLFRSEGRDPLAAKKKISGDTLTMADPAKGAHSAGLSMIFTSETRAPSVNATMDASMDSMLLMREALSQNSAGLQDSIKRLQAMVKVSQDLGALVKPEALLEKIMDNIFDMFPHADRAFIMLRKINSTELFPAMGRTRNAQATGNDEFPISKTIINAVVENKQSILSSDAQKDDRFLAQQSIVNLSIRSLMCAPFICKNELLGVISVDTMSSRHAFSTDDLAMLTSVAGQAAIAIKNAELYTAVEKETQTRTQLSRYLSPDVVEGVLDGTIPLTLGGEKKHGTVFFCDIVGFTAMAESLEAMAVVDLLNKYFRITTEIVTRNKGTLHKFGGDMIMAFWNVMLKDDDAQTNAIRASIEMQAAVWKFGCELSSTSRPKIFVGIGINTGEFAGGNIGGIDRMEYTVIGDNVNLAQRFESLASRWQVFVAQQTYDPASSQCTGIRLPSTLVKGKSRPVPVYSIRGICSDNDTMLLAIPVTILSSTFANPIHGFLSAWQKSKNLLSVLLPLECNLKENDFLVCEFDCPECSNTMKVSGFTKTIFDPTADYPYCKEIKISCTEKTEGITFFQAGTLIESNKTWKEMSRH